jgi:hypothetical protein
VDRREIERATERRWKLGLIAVIVLGVVSSALTTVTLVA